jgi:hypothetical protein
MSAEKLALINAQWQAAEEAAKVQQQAAEEAASAQRQAAEEAANVPGYQKKLKREMRRRRLNEEVKTPSPSVQRDDNGVRPTYNDASPMARHADSSAASRAGGGGAGPRRSLAYPPAPAPAPGPAPAARAYPSTSALPIDTLVGDDLFSVPLLNQQQQQPVPTRSTTSGPTARGNNQTAAAAPAAAAGAAAAAAAADGVGDDCAMQ